METLAEHHVHVGDVPAGVVSVAELQAAGFFCVHPWA